MEFIEYKRMDRITRQETIKNIHTILFVLSIFVMNTVCNAVIKITNKISTISYPMYISVELNTYSVNFFYTMKFLSDMLKNAFLNKSLPESGW